MISDDDVVLADLWTGGPVPALRGRIVAAWQPLAFVSDHETRQQDVARFFGWQALPKERQEILRRYSVTYLLLDRSRQPRGLVKDLRGFGHPVHEDERFLLLRVTGLAP
jgi:hypothetical protein